MSSAILAKERNLLPFIESNAIFAGLEPREKESIARNSSFVLLEEDFRVFEEGAPANGAYVISTGRVVMKKRTHKGSKVVAEIVGPGDPFGLVSAAQGMSYPLTAKTLRESVVLHIEQAELERLTLANPTFLQYLLKLCTQRMQAAHSLMAFLADASTEVRIASALLVFAEKFGTRNDGVLSVDVTRQELAHLASTAVETCIRITKNFEHQGMVSFPAAKHIDIVKLDDLRRMCQTH